MPGLLDNGASSSDGISIRLYCTGVGDETAKVQAWVNAGIAQKMPLIGADMTVFVSSTIDMRAQNLVVQGNSLFIRRTNFTGTIVYLGGFYQRVTGLQTGFQTQATLAQTSAVCFEFFRGFECTYDNLTAELGYQLFRQGQSGWSGDTSNTVFSCTMTNWFGLGWTDLALDFRAWPAGGASNTGNVWSNIYMHNNYPGSAQPCNGYARLVDHDEGAFTEMNFEHGIPAGDLVFQQRCRNMNWISIHFEGITLSSAAGDIALMRAYEACIINVQGISLIFSTIANDANQKSIFRAQHIAGSPMVHDITGVNVRNLTNVGARPLAAFQVETAGAGGQRVELKAVNTTELSGSVIVGDATGTQVRRINADYRGGLAETKPTVTGSKGANAALTSLMTTLATLGIVTDSTS
jgi:hypothetical protein